MAAERAAVPARTPLLRLLLRWRERDREAWIAGTTPGDPFDDAKCADHLSPSSVAKALRGYDRYQAFLAARGRLDPSADLMALMTERLRRAYFVSMRRAGNAPYTIIGRFAELRMAVRIMAPEADAGQVVRLGGVTVYSLLPKTRRNLLVPDAGVLVAWALGMMDKAMAAPDTLAARLALRDGLILAMLAARGRRLRAMVALCVGQELKEQGDRYMIDLPPHLVKTKKPDRFLLPAELTPYMRHYLAVVRPALLKRHNHAALWPTQSGKPLTAKGFQAMVFRRTRVRFGTEFGPHRFRHALDTTAALRAPDQPELGARVLNISPAVSEAHYNRAGQIEATMMLDTINQRRRKELREQFG
ncbi:MAG: integrase [Rhodospirillales bacterium]|nr:integrase [Rhodospirillales bacterium]